LHANIKIKTNVRIDGKIEKKIIETTVGRVLFNQFVPEEVGFVNALLTKKNLRDIIGDIIKITNVPKTAKFLDDIKTLGFRMAFRGGLSFSVNDLIVPDLKQELLDGAKAEVEKLMPDTLPKNGSVSDMVLSGARGSMSNITQMAGMKA
jgi:DNA-directed RNA polymerase subunit beta'